jgi:hypothetical protein
MTMARPWILGVDGDRWRFGKISRKPADRLVLSVCPAFYDTKEQVAARRKILQLGVNVWKIQIRTIALVIDLRAL